MITIAEGKITDIETIQEIAKITWPVTFKNILSAEQIQYMLQMMYSADALKKQMNIKNHKFLLAKDGSDCIGYASYEVHYNKLPKTKIHKIYILPTVQGKGIGKLLIDKIAGIAENVADKSLLLNVNRDNAAVKFYERVGFTVIGREDIPIGNDFLMEDYIMEKPI